MTSNFTNHIFFSKLINNTIKPNEFVKIIAPFYYAVYMWPVHLKKYLYLLKQYNLTNNISKFINLLTENINDEYGIMYNYQDLNLMHTTTFINFLHVFNYTSDLRINDAVSAFNYKILLHMQEKTLAEHSHLLGTIELLYIEISHIIVEYCNKNNITQKHYITHETVDHKHAEDFFTISRELNINSVDMYQSSTNGYQMLSDVFESMYVQYLQNIC